MVAPASYRATLRRLFSLVGAGVVQLDVGGGL